MGTEAVPTDLKLPFSFSRSKDVKIKLRDDHPPGDDDIWQQRESQWKDFWKTKGKEGLAPSSKAFVNGRRAS